MFLLKENCLIKDIKNQELKHFIKKGKYLLKK